MSNDTNDFFKQSIRAINMRKSLHSSDSPLFPNSDDWLVLGHFDTLSITDIGTVSVSGPHMLEQVWKDFSNREDDFCQGHSRGYRHVLYLLPTNENETARKPDHEYPFMFISRIRKNSRYQEAKEKQSLSDTVKMILGQDVLFLYYPALGLSDLILIMYSDSLECLMQKVERLLFCPYIGDTYTYCCVSKNALLSTGVNISDQDTLPLVSMRLAVRNAEEAEQRVSHWRTLKQEHLEERQADCVKQNVIGEAYVVTGTADINLLIHNISSYAFTCFLRNILTDKNYPLWDAFDDMTTRLGSSFSTAEMGEKPCGSCKLDCKDPGGQENALYDAFMHESVSLWEITKNVKASWVKPLSELMNTFIYLSKNRVLDQLCYVLLSSVQGFLVKLKEADDKFKYVSDLYAFVDGLAFVKEHIIRQESQLLLHPETRPVLFSLPVNTIESYLTFIDLFADFLQLNDSPDRRKHFFFLIVPCLCEKVTVRSLLYKKEESNHLLYIKVPLEHCYSPKEVVQALAHEIGHYSGECSRKRGERFKILLWCCAYFICERLRFGPNEETMLYSIKRIEDKLLQQVPEEDQRFMKTVEPCLETACLALIHDEKFIYLLRDKAVQRETDAKEKLRTQRTIDEAYEQMRETDGINYVIDVMKEVQMLSQECYADIAMFSLLNVSALDYIKLIWERRDSGLAKQDERTGPMSKALLLERMSLVIFTARNGEITSLSAEAEKEELSGSMKQLIQLVVIYCGALGNLDQSKLIEKLQELADDKVTSILYNLHPLGVTFALQQYLNECYQAMPKKEAYGEGAEIDKLYKSVVSFDGSTETNTREAIEKYHRKIIAQSIGTEEAPRMEKILTQVGSGDLSAEKAIDLLIRNFQLSEEDAKTIVSLAAK